MFSSIFKSLFRKESEKLADTNDAAAKKFNANQVIPIMISIVSLTLSIFLFYQDYRDNIAANVIIYHEEVYRDKSSSRLGDGFPIVVGYAIFNSGNRPLFVSDLGLTYEDFSGTKDYDRNKIGCGKGFGVTLSPNRLITDDGSKIFLGYVVDSKSIDSRVVEFEAADFEENGTLKPRALCFRLSLRGPNGALGHLSIPIGLLEENKNGHYLIDINPNIHKLHSARFK